jgi:hypothetical protein
MATAQTMCLAVDLVVIANELACVERDQKHTEKSCMKYLYVLTISLQTWHPRDSSMLYPINYTV